MRAFLAAALFATLPARALAQHEGHQAPPPKDPHAGHQMPAPKDPHAGHQMPAPKDPHAGHQMPAPKDPHAGHQMPPAGSPAPPAGYAPVSIDPDRASALQLSTAPVQSQDFTRTVRTVGVVALDETRTAHVHSKVRGWIDELRVDFVGRKVRAGEPLCFIYSQEVYSAEIELISLLGRAPPSGGTDPLLEAAKRRLALWDVPQSEIDRLVRTREARRTFPLLAPHDGVVVAKEALHGMYIDPSVELFTLSDLSRVWVLADVYEADVPSVRLGQQARLEIAAHPAPLEAKVAFLAPTLDEATRTRKVRLELSNPERKLLPGAFVTVELRLPVGRGLAIPEDAVIRTGTRSIVFVAHGDPASHFEPREVKLGPLVGDHYRVDSGVEAGERVATGAQFLLDSESRLRASGTGGGGHVH